MAPTPKTRRMMEGLALHAWASNHGNTQGSRVPGLVQLEGCRMSFVNWVPQWKARTRVTELYEELAAIMWGTIQASNRRINEGFGAEIPSIKDGCRIDSTVSQNSYWWFVGIPVWYVPLFLAPNFKPNIIIP